MSKLTSDYIAVNEGRMAKSEFLRQARMGFPGIVTQFNSYDDAITILRKKGLLSEEVVYRCKADRFPLESIERGIRWELENMGIDLSIETPGTGDYKRARQLAIDNLCKDPEFYLKKIARCCDSCDRTQEEAEQKFGKDYKQPDDHMKEIKPKQSLQEGDLSMHKDVNMNADVGSGTEQAPKVKRAVVHRDRTLDHDWSADDYKVAYIVAEYGKKGIEAVASKCDVKGLDVSNIAVANYIINCSSAALQLVLQGIRKFELGDYRNDKDRTEFLASYRMNRNFLKAYEELHGKSLEDCVQSIDPSKVGSESADIRGLEKKEDDRRKRANNRGKEMTVEKQRIKTELERVKTTAMTLHISNPSWSRDRCLKIAKFKNNWSPEIEAQAKKFGLMESAYTDARYGWSEDDATRVGLVQALLKKINPETGKKYTQSEARKKADKMIKAHKAKQAVKNVEESKQAGIDRKLLNETITRTIVRVLSEAATANLAQLSDQNASVQNIPAILNNLENVVTEIESFIIKEQSKIQSIFDSVGDIKNEDNIPVGYKFVQPIMDAFRKDLEPVLQKIDLSNIKLPEAPELGQDSVAPEMSSEEPLEGPEEKETVFTPKRPLAEARQPKKRYTR